MKKIILYVIGLCLLGICLVALMFDTNGANKAYVEKAEAIVDSVYKYYGIEGTSLLRENYPFDSAFKAGYLASEEQANRSNPYSYLWPYSGSLSAVGALVEVTGNKEYVRLFNERVLKGLEEYRDDKRNPTAYSSYVKTAPQSDRFYDDNIWLGIDFTDMYLATENKEYLEKAKMIWKFIESGMDDSLGGGIYWCEQKKKSKNTCSNAPGSVYALKLFKATGDSAYFKQGEFLYHWTKKNLQDPEDLIYWDNINLEGHITEWKFAYNSGQMMQSAALLYQLTGKQDYLKDAQQLAEACYNFFFKDFTSPEGEQFRLLNPGNIWFTAVMFRGYVELYGCDNNDKYINAFRKNLDYAWAQMRDSNGLFNSDWSGVKKDEKKWLLTQWAMAEMYARLSGTMK